MQAYFLYSVFYKWGAGISKMVTCFLLLAISAPHMVAFNRFCLGMIAYILGYSISCSIATVFQCGSDPRANWDPSLDRKDCFYKPPFWFAHGGLNTVAIIATGTLPWWLFMEVTVRRRHWIATLMTILVIGWVINPHGCGHGVQRHADEPQRTCSLRLSSLRSLSVFSAP